MIDKEEAFLECRCGACRITLCDPKVRARVECLCFDCRQRALISASRNPANSLPEPVAKYERGIDLMYFANAMIVDDDSKELLEFSKLTEEAFNMTAISTCCGTLMCGTHPMYQGSTISVNADSCRVTTPSSILVQAVVFACDCPKESAEKIHKNSPVPVLFSVYEEMESPTMQEFVAAVTEPISDAVAAKETTSFEDLSASKPLIVNNAFFDESRSV